MSLDYFNAQIEAHVRKLVKQLFEVELREIPLATPPSAAMGDIAVSVAFGLAKTLRKGPPQISAELAAKFGTLSGVRAVKQEGPYLNLFLDRAAVLEAALRPSPSSAASQKIIVEHTNINPNKAAHIGHLRNAVLGDTLVRMLRFLGNEVEVHNYIDDTGVQVADVVVGFEHLDKLDLAKITALSGKFDFYCWDLYTKVGKFYEEDKAREKIRQDMLLAIEHGGNSSAEIAEYVADRIVRCHVQTMLRLGITYDILPRESSILKLKFWHTAFELLKQSKAIYKADAGKNKDCWVMLSSDKSASDNAEEQEKVIVRSNGTVTYVGKDIAYQLWKVGLLGQDFNYRIFHTYQDGHELWESTAAKGENQHPSFGAARRVYNVIDNRQAYLQKIVKQGLVALGHTAQADNSVHFSYEMVALTPQCARELGLSLSAEDQARSFVEMSGRKGLGVKADDLLDRLFERCQKEVKARNPELESERCAEIARQIGVGALRYFMLKHGENHVLAFDFDQALAFEGETGPYLQNAVVRAQSILRKLEGQGSKVPDSTTQFAAKLEQVAGKMESDHWEFVLSLLRIEKCVEESAQKLQLSAMAKYAFALAQRFHSFYHHNPIAQESDMELREMRLFITLLFIERMRGLLGLMGVEIPERM